LELYDKIITESRRLKHANEPLFLTTEQMLALAESNPNNDIMDFEELCSGKLKK